MSILVVFAQKEDFVLKRKSVNSFPSEICLSAGSIDPGTGLLCGAIPAIS
jgi:hypothetical protein